MKTKLLVALITCLALSACSKSESGKDEKKAGAESTQGTHQHGTEQHPATPAGTPHSMNEGHTTLAAEGDQAAPAATQEPTSNPTTTPDQEAEKKVQDMKHDMSNTATQVQGGDNASSTSTTNNNATDNKADTHNHED